MDKEDQPQISLDSNNKRDVSRARQTFFRTSFKAHMTFAAMVDRKANIMVRLNSILLTALMLFHKYIIDFSDLSQITLLILVFTTLISLILAILVVRPGLVGHVDQDENENISENIFAVKSIGRIPLEKFEKAFSDILLSTKLLYGNMIKDLHHYDKLLSKKFQLLRASYTIFLVGMILTVVSFIVISIAQT